MKYKLLDKKESILYIESENVLVSDSQSVLDFIMTVNYETDCRKIVLDKNNISEKFFTLSNGVAGEVCQKLVNYRFKIAIIGEYSKYTSKPLHDFIYECNRGNDIFFVDNLEEAVEKLTLAY